MDDERETSQLRERRMKSPVHLSCCFHRHHSRLDSSNPPSPYSSDSEKSSPSFRSPSSWFRSKGSDHHLPGRRRHHFMARLGHRHRRHSADFSYDPLSYALNFDAGSTDEPVNDQHFVSRLPVSPPRVRSARPRFKDLELPSPRPSGRKNVESPMKPKGTEGTAAAGSGKAKSQGGRGRSSESPMAVHGRKSPAHGRKGLESPTEAQGGKRFDSPTAVNGAHGGKSSKSPKEAHGPRKVQSPTVEPGKKSTDSPKAAKEGKISRERRNAAHVVGAILGAMYA